jgi:hypothetical protein
MKIRHIFLFFVFLSGFFLSVYFDFDQSKINAQTNAMNIKGELFYSYVRIETSDSGLFYVGLDKPEYFPGEVVTIKSYRVYGQPGAEARIRPSGTSAPSEVIARWMDYRDDVQKVTRVAPSVVGTYKYDTWVINNVYGAVTTRTSGPLSINVVKKCSPLMNQACSESNACYSVSGVYDCEGKCVVVGTLRPLPDKFGQLCSSQRNSCSAMTRNKTIGCEGTCVPIQQESQPADCCSIPNVKYGEPVVFEVEYSHYPTTYSTFEFGLDKSIYSPGERMDLYQKSSLDGWSLGGITTYDWYMIVTTPTWANPWERDITYTYDKFDVTTWTRQEKQRTLNVQERGRDWSAPVQIGTYEFKIEIYNETHKTLEGSMKKTLYIPFSVSNNGSNDLPLPRPTNFGELCVFCTNGKDNSGSVDCEGKCDGNTAVINLGKGCVSAAPNACGSTLGVHKCNAEGGGTFCDSSASLPKGYNDLCDYAPGIPGRIDCSGKCAMMSPTDFGLRVKHSGSIWKIFGFDL